MYRSLVIKILQSLSKNKQTSLPTKFQKIQTLHKKTLNQQAELFVDSILPKLTPQQQYKEHLLTVKFYFIISFQNTKPADLYKQIDVDFHSFFQTREYNIKNFNFLITILGEQKKTHLIPDTLQLMDKLKIKPTIGTYIALIKSEGKCLNIKKAEEYYDIAKSSLIISHIILFLIEYGNSIYLSTTLLYAYCRSKLPDQADRLFREMKEDGLYLDIPAYTTLINTHYKSNNLNKCWDLFMEMRTGAFHERLDENIYGLMIEICAHTNDAEKAISLHNMMQDLEFKDSTHVFNALIKALGSRKDYAQRGIEHYQEMMAKGVPIDSDTIVHTLKACAQIGDVKTAFEVLQLMKDRKIAPNKYIYNQILKVYSGACKLEYIPEKTIDLYIKDSWIVFKEIQEKGLVHINVLNSLGELMMNAGKLAELEGLVFPLFDQYGIKKNEYTYQSMVKLLAEERRIVDVQRVWDVIHKENLQPTFETICLYLEMAILESNEDRVIEALEWFIKIKRQPKNKYLKYLGELHQVPVRIHSILMEFEDKYGIAKDKVLRQRKTDKYIPV